MTTTSGDAQPVKDAGAQDRPSLANWREPQHSKWTFRHIEEIIPVNHIKSADQPSNLPKKLRDVSTFSVSDSTGTSLDLDAFLKATCTDGLLVLRKGQIIYESYHNDNTATTKHILMSVTKSIIGLLYGILSSPPHSLLNLTSPISTHVPELTDTLLGNATLRSCLDMRSGITYADAAPEFRAATGWAPPLTQSEIDANLGKHFPDLHAFVTGFDQRPAPHDGFLYCSLNTDLLGWVLERATGKTLAALIEELIWRPMGAESDAWMTADAAGNARAAGGLCATVRDLARVGLLIERGGDGVVPESWIEDLVKGGNGEAWRKGSWARGFKGWDALAYRGFCLADKESQVVMGLGIHGQMLVVDREEGVVLAKTGSLPVPSDGKSTLLTLAAFDEFKRIILRKGAV